MLTVITYVDKSPIDGLGLFSGQHIKKGTVVWKFAPFIDQYLTEDNIRMIRSQCVSREIYVEFRRHVAKYKDQYLMFYDNARFINHSLFPNLTECSDGIVIAKKDIVGGEELTENYLDLYEDPEDLWFLQNGKYW